MKGVHARIRKADFDAGPAVTHRAGRADGRVLGLRARADGQRPRRPSTGSSRPGRTPCAATRPGCWSGTTRSAPSAAAAEERRSAHRGDPRAGGRPRPRARRRGHRARARWPRAADPAVGRAATTAGRSPRPTWPSRRPRSTRGSGGWSGTRCCRARRTGPLSGESVAVKDLYAVAGQRVGAGNPAWLDQAPVEPTSAWAVQRLLDAGADVTGIARTDEFAYSPGRHQRAVRHPAQPEGVAPRSPAARPRGSASAVSLGHATVGSRDRHRRLDPGAGGVPGALGHPHHARARADRTGCSRSRRPSTRSGC